MRSISLLASLVTITVCAVVAAFVVGGAGVSSALIAGLIVLAFFGSTPAILGPLATTSPRLSLVAAVVFFFTKVIALVALFLLLARAAELGTWLDAEVLSVTIIVTTVVWLVTRIIDAARTRQPMYDLPDTQPESPDTFDAR